MLGRNHLSLHLCCCWLWVLFEQMWASNKDSDWFVCDLLYFIGGCEGLAGDVAVCIGDETSTESVWVGTPIGNDIAGNVAVWRMVLVRGWTVRVSMNDDFCLWI